MTCIVNVALCGVIVIAVCICHCLINCCDVPSVTNDLMCRCTCHCSIDLWGGCCGTYRLHAHHPTIFHLSITHSRYGSCINYPYPHYTNHRSWLRFMQITAPWSPFASTLVTDWSQCHRCLPHMHMVPLYKRACPPSPLLIFWLDVTPVTSESGTDSSPRHSPDCRFTL